MTPARSRDDLPDPPQKRNQPGAALRAARVEALQQPTDVIVAAEVDRGVLLFESEHARKRRAMRVPLEAALSVERDSHQLPLEPLKPAVPVAQQIERLDVGRNQRIAGWRDDRREDGLAERSGLREFGEAPFRGEPVRRLDNDNRLGLLDLAVERPFPIRARRNARHLVLVEKSRLEAHACEPGLHLRRLICVGARVGNENPGHDRFLCRSLGKRCL